MEIRNGLEGSIGGTPLIRLNGVSQATGCDVLGKAEFLAPEAPFGRGGDARDHRPPIPGPAVRRSGGRHAPGVIGETAAHPNTAQLFYETGPAATIGAVGRLLAHEMDQGRLRRDDPEYAAGLFLNMIRGHYQLQRLLGIDPGLTDQAVDAHIRKAIAQLLTLYTP